MSISSSVIEVTTSATLLASGGHSINDVVTVVLSNAEGNIYIGGSDVDSTDGTLLTSSSAPLTLILGPGDDLYGIAGSALDISVLTTRQTS